MQQANSATGQAGGTNTGILVSTNVTSSDYGASSYKYWKGPSVKAPWETVWFDGPDCVAKEYCGDLSDPSCVCSDCSYIQCYKVDGSAT